ISCGSYSLKECGRTAKPLDLSYICVMKHGSHASNLDMVNSYLKGDRPITQVGYTEAEDLTNHKIGETWTDSQGKTWQKTEYGKTAATPLMDMVNAELN